MEGRIALIQETHWDPATAALWAGLFPGCKVLSSPARPGPQGGPQGGVAILLPPTWHCVEHKVMAPGCALQATVRPAQGGAEVIVQTVYFPPEAREEVATAYLAALERYSEGGPFCFRCGRL